MKAISIAGRALLGASVLIALSACDAPEKSTAPAVSTQTQPGMGKVVFTKAFSDSGVFQILENRSGSYNTLIQARIGSQAEKLLHGSSGQPTLEGVYSSLNGGTAEIPAIVSMASEQLEQDNPPPSTALPDPEPGVDPAPSLAKTSSFNDFYSRYCHDFKEGSWRYRLMDWDWWDGSYEVAVFGVNSDDRVYGWNNTQWTASMVLYGNPYTPSLPPYTVAWFTWGGTYTQKQALVRLPSGPNIYGELGITRHKPEPYIQ